MAWDGLDGLWNDASLGVVFFFVFCFSFLFFFFFLTEWSVPVGGTGGNGGGGVSGRRELKI